MSESHPVVSTTDSATNEAGPTTCDVCKRAFPTSEFSFCDRCKQIQCPDCIQWLNCPSRFIHPIMSESPSTTDSATNEAGPTACDVCKRAFSASEFIFCDHCKQFQCPDCVQWRNCPPSSRITRTTMSESPSTTDSARNEAGSTTCDVCHGTLLASELTFCDHCDQWQCSDCGETVHDSRYRDMI